MTTKHEIEIEGLPEGWRAVSYRYPKKGEHYYTVDRIIYADHDFHTGYLIVEKIKPRRIVLEETEVKNIITLLNKLIEAKEGE